ncbi:MAG TPA: pirin family protein [Pseudoneobacillus sp.]|nr:pirin family protein [Pseudoneobacillus sp.]
MDNISKIKRQINKTWEVKSRAGGGPHLKVAQVIAPGNWNETDPFLMLAEDWFQQGTFDFHPHRGFETVTYVLDGKLKHEDNHGGKGILEPGDVQWMTAGSGIIHSEDPLPGETVHSLQLWLNLPRTQKWSEPSYQDLKGDSMPVRKETGASIKVFSGNTGDVVSSTKNLVPVTFLEIQLEEGAEFTQDLPSSYNGFLYILEGSGYFGSEETFGVKNNVLWTNPVDGAEESLITIRAEKPLKVLLYAGEPIGERVVARGPFVMTSEEEINQAIDDYYSGKFGRI